jgi:hypothetical protein
MLSRLLTVAVLAAASMAAALPASAEDCKLQMLASVPTETDIDGSMLLPGNFGGSRKLLLVDTGGFFHMLRPNVIRELSLPVRESQMVAVVDVLGRRTSRVARAPAFAIGNMTPTPVDFVEIPNERLLGSNDEVAGLFVPGVYFRSLDVDLDFPNRKFNLLSQDHCAGHVVYWPNEGVAVVPFQYDDSNHIVFPVKVDGASMRATLDSGASYTTMFTRAALRLGVDVSNSGDVVELGRMGGGTNIVAHARRFRSLSIEGVSVSNPIIALIPDMNTRMPEGPSIRDSSGGLNDTRLSAPRSKSGADMLIGMSVLKHLHVYIATRERKLYITAGVAAAPTVRRAPSISARPSDAPSNASDPPSTK